MQALHRQKFRLTHDALYNLHELAYDMNEFFFQIATFPDLVVICGLKPILKEINRLLQLSGMKSYHQLLSYDTTVDFYVSALLFRNVLFKKSPVMPAMFLVHERKLHSTHVQMMEVIASQLPSLVQGSSRIPMVTDDEKGFVQAVDKVLHNVRRFYCWNHVINATKLWLRRHGATSSEVPVYVSHLRELFHHESRQGYDCHLEEVKGNWSEAFLSYYMTEIHNKVGRLDCIIASVIFFIMYYRQLILCAGGI